MARLIQPTTLKHEDLANGGTLEFILTNKQEKAMLFEQSDQQILKQAASIPYVLKATRNFNHSTNIDLYSDTPEAKIYYTLDGSIPTEKSPLFTKELILKKSATIKAIATKEGLLPSVIFEKEFVKSAPIEYSDLTQGLKYKVYNGIYRSVYDWQNDSPVKEGVFPTFSLDCRERDEWYGLHFDGYIYIPADDIYTFTLFSNDGGQMLINGEELFESDGRKSHSLLQRL